MKKIYKKIHQFLALLVLLCFSSQLCMAGGVGSVPRNALDQKIEGLSDQEAQALMHDLATKMDWYLMTLKKKPMSHSESNALISTIDEIYNLVNVRLKHRTIPNPRIYELSQKPGGKVLLPLANYAAVSSMLVFWTSLFLVTYTEMHHVFANQNASTADIAFTLGTIAAYIVGALGFVYVLSLPVEMHEENQRILAEVKEFNERYEKILPFFWSEIEKKLQIQLPNDWESRLEVFGRFLSGAYTSAILKAREPVGFYPEIGTNEECQEVLMAEVEARDTVEIDLKEWFPGKR